MIVLYVSTLKLRNVAVVAPLETIRTHLMVGSSGHRTIVGVFRWIMQKEGWRGLFRGNAINVLRVAPGKAVELFTYDTVKKLLTPPDGGKPIIPIPPSSIAGSAAGVAACCLMYPLELVKTRLTIQPGEYRSILHAFYRIITEEGAHELYRGLGPSLIGIVPYAGSNYFAYDTLRTLYKRLAKKDKIEPLATLIIGSLAGAAAASATFPLEVARKQPNRQFAGSNYLAYDTLCTLAGAGLRRCACWAAVCFFLSLGAASGFAGAASAASFATAPASPTFPLKERVSRTHPTNEQSDAPVPTPTAVAATFTAPPASPAFTQPLLEFPLPAVEFSLRELAACTRGFSPDAMLAMDWAGAVYRGCCHVGKGHVGGEGPHLEGPTKEAPRDSAKRAQSPADQCCCATCQELTATECVTLRGGCARVKRWRYLPSSLPPPPSTSAAADATGSRSTSSEQGPTASDSMPSHTPEQAQISGEVDSSVSAGREMMGRLAAAAASHMNLLPIVGFSCSEELLLVFRSNPSARSLEYALARAGSPSALSSWSARLSIARQIAGGLDHLHSHSFLHASLRPANVLLHAVGSTQRCSPQSPSHLSDREQRWWRHMLRRKARAESAAQVRVQLADYGMPCQARDGQGSEGKSLGCVVFGDAKYLDPAFMGSGRPVWAGEVPPGFSAGAVVY
ncbi:unnamed protein product [Closterium sp. Naga37s-1]|nr:unnamed protein product [Closterium sp. Naga37s-1]